mgnify:CR=1 FL=1
MFFNSFHKDNEFDVDLQMVKVVEPRPVQEFTGLNRLRIRIRHARPFSILKFIRKLMNKSGFIFITE